MDLQQSRRAQVGVLESDKCHGESGIEKGLQVWTEREAGEPEEIEIEKTYM